MRIEWVNHASYVLESGSVRLLCDPWLRGTAFHDAWALLAPTAFRAEDFASITHLWFSHEHPDHFRPGEVRAIPEAARRAITVIFQTTRDRKVVERYSGRYRITLDHDVVVAEAVEFAERDVHSAFAIAIMVSVPCLYSRVNLALSPTATFFIIFLSFSRNSIFIAGIRSGMSS